MKLAAMLGMTVAECQDKLSTDEFLWWRAYMRAEPPVADRVEVMLAGLMALNASMATGQHHQPSEFMVDWLPETEDPEAAYERIEKMVGSIIPMKREDTDGD